MYVESRIGLVGGLGLLAGMSGMLAVSQEEDSPAVPVPMVAAAEEPGAPREAPAPGAPSPEIGTTLSAPPMATVPADQDPGGVFQLLRSILLGYKGPVAELVQDRERFRRFFPPGQEGPTVSGQKYLTRPDDVVEDGATLAFPKGVFWLRNLMHYRRWFPADVKIRGAGMDDTLLYMDPVRSQGPVRNLRIQDCTLFVPGTILDLGNGPATLRCERVRLLGFDTLPDGRRLHQRRHPERRHPERWHPDRRHPRPMPALVTAEAALHFVDCRFEGGYGDHPTRGALMHSWSPAVMARFDGCRFSRMHLSVPPDPATVVFADCVLEDLCGDPREQAMHNEGTRFRSCRFENHWLPRQRRQLLHLEVLFPGWRERLVQ